MGLLHSAVGQIDLKIGHPEKDQLKMWLQAYFYTDPSAPDRQLDIRIWQFREFCTQQLDQLYALNLEVTKYHVQTN